MEKIEEKTTQELQQLKEKLEKQLEPLIYERVWGRRYINRSRKTGRVDTTSQTQPSPSYRRAAEKTNKVRQPLGRCGSFLIIGLMEVSTLFIFGMRTLVCLKVT